MRMTLEASAAVVDCSAYSVLAALVDPLRVSVAEATAVVEGSAGAFEAASAPVAWMNCVACSHRSAPEIRTVPASNVSPILLRPHA